MREAMQGMCRPQASRSVQCRCCYPFERECRIFDLRKRDAGRVCCARDRNARGSPEAASVVRADRIRASAPRHTVGVDRDLAGPGLDLRRLGATEAGVGLHRRHPHHRVRARCAGAVHAQADQLVALAAERLGEQLGALLNASTAPFINWSSFFLRVASAMLKSMPPIFSLPSRSAESWPRAAKSELSRRSSARSRQPVIFWPCRRRPDSCCDCPG